MLFLIYIKNIYNTETNILRRVQPSVFIPHPKIEFKKYLQSKVQYHAKALIPMWMPVAVVVLLLALICAVLAFTLNNLTQANIASQNTQTDIAQIQDAILTTAFLQTQVAISSQTALIPVTSLTSTPQTPTPTTQSTPTSQPTPTAPPTPTTTLTFTVSPHPPTKNATLQNAIPISAPTASPAQVQYRAIFP